LTILAALNHCGWADFTFVAFITHIVASGEERRPTVAELLHALAWLVDRGFVQTKTRRERDFFWETKQELCTFSLADRGRNLLKRMLAEKWVDGSPEFAVLEEGGTELSPESTAIAWHVIAVYKVGNSVKFPALSRPVIVSNQQPLPFVLRCVFSGMIGVAALLLVYLLVFGGQ
jgi:hypothetical protein